MVCSHWVTLSTCTGDVIVDRRSFVSRGHPSTTQLYTSGWTCMKWTGGRVTSSGERWTHTRGKQKHSFSSAYRTLPFQHTLLVSGAETTSLTGIPIPLPPPLPSHSRLLLPISPSLPFLTIPAHLTILSQPIKELLILFCQRQFEAPVSSNHHEPGRLKEGEREGEREEGGKRWISQPLSVVSTTSWSRIQLPPLPCHKPPLTSCSVSAPPWSAHSAALITNCRLPSVGEADHLVQEKANTPLSMARCTHNWSSTVNLYRGRARRAGGWALVMQ